MIGVHMRNQQATAAYAAAFRRLARMSGFDHRTVLRAEAGSILKAWAGRTKVSTVEKADRRSRLHTVRSLGYTQAKERGDVTVNAGFRPAPFGRIWLKVRNNGGRNAFIMAKGANFTEPTGSGIFTLERRRGYQRLGTQTPVWAGNIDDAIRNVQGKLKTAVAKGRRAMNLSRQSVVQIADSLGIDLARVPGGGLSAAGLAKARAAMATTGVSHRNGMSAQGGNEIGAYVDLINRLPYGVKIGMDRVLAGVVAGRAKFIERAYAKGAFDSVKRTAAAFPGLFILKGPS